MSDKRETLGFQTEVRQLLQLMIHSLYSNKEIFLRELISNASDAADKLRFEALAHPDWLADDPELGIRIEVDKKKKTLTVIDNGIGMSRDELVENLGTIAKSGTAEFLKQMTGDKKHDARLIGQFGVGFYSAFIVADKVTVESRRAGLDAEAAVRWESEGQGEFTVENIERKERGTQVTLHLKKDQSEFAESLRIQALIRKYSDHIGFPVSLTDTGGKDAETKVVNSATALWTRSRSDVTDDEYREFYKHISHDFSDPLRWSHNKVEGKREYTSLLYIPAAAPFDLWNREAPRGLKLYVQRVFIMDDAEQFLPLYLRFVKGVVDSSELPLNVSRELLQQNPEITSMRNALTRRVLDILKKLAGKKDEYQKFWNEFGTVFKEGLVEDQANKDKLAKLLRFATTHTGSETQDQSLDDYLGRCQEDQDKIYYILAEGHATAIASPHLEQLRSRGIEVLLLTDRIDAWVAEALAEYEGKALVDVAREALDMPEKGELKDQDKLNETHKALLDRIQEVLSSRVTAVNVSRRLVNSPACVVASDHDLNPQVRRMLEASGQALPESKPILEINVGHPLVTRLSEETDDRRFGALSEIVLDHALLAEGSPLPNPAEYVQRMNDYLLNAEHGADSEPA
ncbi:MAG: molecular chaperone HtpG [Gammaproteobacteria bacterium]|nr:molecular chaperone HtpG [Gammaproteobacteria bacterium]MDH5239705.1 molecular chaperone HtpG [Gammaproteobacteria bacterium]MDH5582271.1 molecular chaperone HtpG [Gammaproteobacteria bacterium]